ncbi:hypothetical protein RJ639_006729 [Escallonia herrerae]|uniref:Transposase (putative) gypsy type domain-containing protein n=1 Tax=Escallonia herrerae TaxID=1293975 RepID=A0AA89AW48_9ASTE|nr:hypothetical protein RJ639_006729 [Escallonia herrerae]
MTTLDEIGVYWDMFINGFRVPLHPFFIRVLKVYGLAPGQFSPHAWRFKSFFIYQCYKLGLNPRSQRSEVNNVWLAECKTRAYNKLRETDLSETDLEHIEKLKGAEPLEPTYPLSNAQLNECRIIFPPEPQDFVDEVEEEEEGKNDPGYGAGEIGVEKLIAADKVLDEEKKKVMIENNFRREADKKVEDLSKKLERVELSNAGLTAKNVKLLAHVNDLEAEKSSVALQAVQLFKRSKVFLDQCLRDSKGALVHRYNECKSNVLKDHPELDMSICEHKFAREVASETERRAEEAEHKKSASSRVLTSPSMSRSVGASGSASTVVLRP